MMATDAMGANDGDCGDHGGYGIVASAVPHEVVLDCFKIGGRPGRALQKELQLQGRASPEKPLARTVPFTRLPPVLFDESRTFWHVLAHGRWSWSEHITRGEMRAVLRMLIILASCSRCHRSRILSLQDNMGVASILSKGRSSTPVLNYLARRRCALCCFSEIYLLAPWVESAKQPADKSSRDVATEEDRPTRG